jgi:hypothetical protein
VIAVSPLATFSAALAFAVVTARVVIAAAL